MIYTKKHKMKNSTHVTTYQKNLELKKELPQIITDYSLGKENFPRLTQEAARFQAQGCKRASPMLKSCAGPVGGGCPSFLFCESPRGIGENFTL